MNKMPKGETPLKKLIKGQTIPAHHAIRYIIIPGRDDFDKKS